MRIEFIKDGGFGRAGGFVEVGEDEETERDTGRQTVYQREAFLSVRVDCHEVCISHTFFDRYVEAKQRRRISAIGRLGAERWGKWTLSMLGSRELHDTVSVHIHESSEDKVQCYAAGTKASKPDDIDFDFEESFFVEMHVPSSQFVEVLNELTNHRCALSLNVAFDKFPNFLSTWSPSINEGRTIKFLDDIRDVSNAEDIPEKFFSKEPEHRTQSSEHESPISITLSRQILTMDTASNEDEAVSGNT